MGRSDPDEDDEDKVEDGRLSQLTLRLTKFDEDAINYEGVYVPKIPLPSEMVMANDVKDGGGMPNMTEEETIACLLNAYNVRHYVHKKAQISSGGREFVISIEYDVRQSGDRVKYGQKSFNEVALTLTVTLRSDGLEAGFPDVHRKYFLYFTNADEGEEGYNETSFEPAEEWIGHSMARPKWATVRGLLPLGIDFILGHPYYSAVIEKAESMGKRVEVMLYDISPIFNERGEANTTDLSITRMMYYIQSVCQGDGKGYGHRFNLSRLPDGYTGEEVDKDPEPTVDIMRRLEAEGKFVGQPLLVTDEEKCMPKQTHPMEYFRLELENFDIEWGRNDVETFGHSY